MSRSPFSLRSGCMKKFPHGFSNSTNRKFLSKMVRAASKGHSQSFGRKLHSSWFLFPVARSQTLNFPGDFESYIHMTVHEYSFSDPLMDLSSISTSNHNYLFSWILPEVALGLGIHTRPFGWIYNAPIDDYNTFSLTEFLLLQVLQWENYTRMI